MTQGETSLEKTLNRTVAMHHKPVLKICG